MSFEEPSDFRGLGGARSKIAVPGCRRPRSPWLAICPLSAWPRYRCSNLQGAFTRTHLRCESSYFLEREGAQTISLKDLKEEPISLCSFLAKLRAKLAPPEALLRASGVANFAIEATPAFSERARLRWKERAYAKRRGRVGYYL